MKNDLLIIFQSLFILAAAILFMIALSVCGKIFSRYYYGYLGMGLVQPGRILYME